MALKTFSITVPAAGEPIDLTFMTTLADYIRQINEELIRAKMAMSSLDTAGIRKTLETEDVSIWTGYHDLGTVAKGTGPKELAWTVNYAANVSFAARPLVSATPILNAGSSVSNSVWVNKIDQSSATGVFRFNEKTTRDERPRVMVIAIGVGVVQ